MKTQHLLLRELERKRQLSIENGADEGQRVWMDEYIRAIDEGSTLHAAQRRADKALALHRERQAIAQEGEAPNV